MSVLAVIEINLKTIEPRSSSPYLAHQHVYMIFCLETHRCNILEHRLTNKPHSQPTTATKHKPSPEPFHHLSKPPYSVPSPDNAHRILPSSYHRASPLPIPRHSLVATPPTPATPSISSNSTSKRSLLSLSIPSKKSLISPPQPLPLITHATNPSPRLVLTPAFTTTVPCRLWTPSAKCVPTLAVLYEGDPRSRRARVARDEGRRAGPGFVVTNMRAQQTGRNGSSEGCADCGSCAVLVEGMGKARMGHCRGDGDGRDWRQRSMSRTGAWVEMKREKGGVGGRNGVLR